MTQPPVDPTEEPLGGALAPTEDSAPESPPTAPAGDYPPPPPPPPPPTGGYPPPPPLSSTYPPAFPVGPTGAYGEVAVKPHRGTLLLGLGIGSLVLSCGCIGLVLGIMTILMANKDLAEMDAGTMDAQGRGNTRTGRVLGYSSIAIFVVSLLLVAIVALTSSTGS